MRWQDLDLEAGWWTIPELFTKNGKPHRVPLVDPAIAIIRVHEPERNVAGGPPYVFAVRNDASIVDRAKKASGAIARVLRIDFRGHDLRRTAATRMAAAGVPRDHISRVLNHAEGGPRATRIYDRHSYDKEKRTALETWARELREIVTTQPGVESVAQRIGRSQGRNDQLS